MNRSRTCPPTLADQPKITTGDVSAPRNTLVDGRRAWEKREYRDGIVAVSYCDADMAPGRERVLVWDRKAGTRGGFLWYRGDSTSAAVEAFRAGARSVSQGFDMPARRAVDLSAS